MTDTDAKVQSLAQKAMASSDPITGSTWAKIGMVIVVAVWTWYIKFELSDKEAELAKAKTDLENAKMDQQQALIQAQSKTLTDSENLSKQMATAKLSVIAEKQKDLDAAIADHNARVGRVKSLQSWEALNFLAGVKS